MANISRKEDLKDLEERTKYGKRMYGRCFPSTDRAVIYNAVHGTNILDNDCLDVYLNNTERIELYLNKIKKIEINLNNTRRIEKDVKYYNQRKSKHREKHLSSRYLSRKTDY